MNRYTLMLAGIVGTVYCGFLLWFAFRKPIAEALRRFRCIPNSAKVVALLSIVIASVQAQKSGGGGDSGDDDGDDGDSGGGNAPLYSPPPMGGLRQATPLPGCLTARRLSIGGLSPRLLSAGSIPPYTVSEEEIARGWRIAYVTNDIDHSYTMPAGAQYVSNVHVHGARSEFGLNSINLGNLYFPLGPDTCSFSDFRLTLDGSIVTPHPPRRSISAGPGVGDALAVQGSSRIWQAEGADNSRILTWENIRRGGDTNLVENYQIVLKEDGNFETWSNETGVACIRIDPGDRDGDGIPDNQDTNPTNSYYGIAGISGSISCPSVIMRGGDMAQVTATFTPPAGADEASAELSFEGGDYIALWDSTNRTQAVTLPMTVPANGTVQFYAEGTNVCSSAGGVRFHLDVTVGHDGATITKPVTVACVQSMEMTCDIAAPNPNPPPFPGEMFNPFRVWVSPNPDKHLLIPYFNALDTTTFTVRDFTVNMSLRLYPDVTPDDLDSEWAIYTAHPESSGELVETGHLTAEFQNPKKGGVYMFKARLAGSPWTYGSVVLPLSGSSVDELIEDDVARVQTFCDRVDAKYTSRGKYSAMNGVDWFYKRGRGDYIGRANRTFSPTVWYTNQVNDVSGLGACCTWCGHPIRNAKISNFLIAYASQKIGVSEEDMQTAREYLRTPDDASAALSWAAGVAVAAGADYGTTVSNMTRTAFLSREPKSIGLWPNLPALDNAYDGMPPRYGYQPNLYFYSPAFLFRNP